MRNRMFSNDIPPACEYCEHGRRAADHIMILCKKRGPVSPHYSCRRFLYSPLRRVPKRRPKLPTFSAEDFEL